MSEENATVDATGIAGAEDGTDRAYLIVSLDDSRTRVVPLPDGAEVTFGRSRGATVMIEHDKVSRMHARVVRRGPHIVVEDLDSRNGTRVNGARITGPVRVAGGDEVGVGPAVAVVAVTTQLRRRTLVGSASALEERLAAEVDRAVRYHRPLGLLMLRLDGASDATEAALDRVAGTLRRMDGLAEYAPDEFAVVVPEAGREATREVAQRLCAEASTRGAVGVHVGMAVYPHDGTRAGELVSAARAALRRARLAGGAEGVAAAPAEAAPAPGDLVVADAQMRRVYEMVDKIAAAPITVLILGETGVGKEIVAEQIHRRSERAAKPFVKLNCASLPETLLESELFGHERGAFTGADKRKIGYFEAAAGGTLFLDEIGETPVALQAKLLRVLEARRLTRVGGTAEIAVDVRLVCATNRDLEAEVKRGRFRQDLYFRVSAFSLLVPPLRDRRAEIALLAEHFARQFAQELKQSPPALTPDARELLEAYAWPGNVRELRNAVERAVVLQPGVIAAEHLPVALREGARAGASARVIRDQLADVERAAIVQAMEACSWNQTHAAQRLGLSRRALIYKLEKYGLKPPPPSSLAR